jgi:hypothetical protein
MTQEYQRWLPGSLAITTVTTVVGTVAYTAARIAIAIAADIIWPIAADAATAHRAIIVVRLITGFISASHAFR